MSWNPEVKYLDNIDSNKCFQFYCHCKFLLFWSEDTSAELEYNKEWEIEDFLRGETMILHLQYAMEKIKEHFEITYGMQSAQKDSDSVL